MDRQEYIKWIKDEITTVKANLQNKVYPSKQIKFYQGYITGLWFALQNALEIKENGQRTSKRDYTMDV